MRMSGTSVLISRLPQVGAFIEAQYQITDKSCCPRCQLAFLAVSSSTISPDVTLRAANEVVDDVALQVR